MKINKNTDNVYTYYERYDKYDVCCTWPTYIFILI